MIQGHEIKAVIDKMVHTVRACSDDYSQQEPPQLWWVLVCGEPFNPLDINQREYSREALRNLASAYGITPREYVWVWDETNKAQLLVDKFQTVDQAKAYARELMQQGLCVRVIEAWEE